MSNIKNINKDSFCRVIGSRLKMSRENSSLTQVEVVEALDISQSSISLFEKGEAFPSIFNLLKFCMLYEVSPGWVLGMETDSSVDTEAMKMLYEI